MSCVLIFLLASTLSGLPAAAVVCDLVLCLEPAKAAAPAAGCHEHEEEPAGAQIDALERCAHLAAVEPGVASVSRSAARLLAAMHPLPLARGELVDSRRAAGWFLVHAPPSASTTGSHVPLRI